MKRRSFIKSIAAALAVSQAPNVFAKPSKNTFGAPVEYAKDSPDSTSLHNIVWDENGLKTVESNSLAEHIRVPKENVEYRKLHEGYEEKVTVRIGIPTPGCRGINAGNKPYCTKEGKA